LPRVVPMTFIIEPRLFLHNLRGLLLELPIFDCPDG